MKKNIKKEKKVRQTSTIVILEESEIPSTTEVVTQSRRGILIIPNLGTFSSRATIKANLYMSAKVVATKVEDTIGDPVVSL